MPETQTLQSEETTPFRMARVVIARALASALADPSCARAAMPVAWQDPKIISHAWGYLIDSFPPEMTQASLGLGEILPDDSVSARGLERWVGLPREGREVPWQRVFGMVVSKECPPYETEFCHWKDATYRAHQLADIAGFYRAFGLEPSMSNPERPDHAATMIEFVAFMNYRVASLQDRDVAAHLVDQTERGLCQFMEDHIAWWMPTFGRCLRGRIESVLDDPTLAPDVRVTLTDFAVVPRCLRVWVAAERIACHVEPCRRIIAPSVDPPDLESTDSCGLCDGGEY